MGWHGSREGVRTGASREPLPSSWAVRTRAGFGHASDKHDCKPAGGRGSLKCGEASARHVGELELSRGRQVAWEAHAGVNQDDVNEA